MTAKKPASESTAVAKTSDAAAPAIVIPGMGTFTVAKQVTLPTLKQNSGDQIVVQIVRAFYAENKSAEQTAKDGGSSEIWLTEVIDLTTGNRFKYVVNAILKNELETQYPEDGYVDRYFAIKKLEAKEGKRYKEMQVVELQKASEPVAEAAE